MSDTTITPEERAEWRSLVMPYPDGKIGNQDRRMLRLIDALEVAEARKEEAEAENARLRAERDWLAENVEGRPCDYDSCPFGLPRPTGPDDGCGKTHVQCWQKALTPLVAESEVGE